MSAPTTHERPLWRTVALLVGFVLVVVAAVVTVLVPELEDEPEQGTTEPGQEEAAEAE
jgi:hypothetical protein